MLRVSDLPLTSAAVRAGVIGAFPTLNARSDTALVEWLEELDAVQSRHRDDLVWRPGSR